MNEGRHSRGYLLVALCYQAFTLSDGALRMLVLLHLHDQGQTAWALALLLVPYEVAGVLTNLLGGYLGARFGLKATLVLGLGLQTIACALLAVDAASLSIAYVGATQVLSGVAKDLAKTSAKSYVKALQPPGGSAGLFRWVALLTGSKNTIKGLGFFVGGALLAWVGFRQTNAGLAVLLAAFALLALAALPRIAGRRTASLLAVLRQDARMWWLSAARMFLFGSRDAWFAVALPLFLVEAGWPHASIGALLAGWVIVYGLVQASAPRLTRAAEPRAGVTATLRWTLSLLVPLLPMAGTLADLEQPVPALVVSLCAYGVLFALTSSLHSWLVVAMHDDHKDPERVGFYYSANAMGRLCGTLASGALFAAGASAGQGLGWCLLASCALVVLAALCTQGLGRAARP
jgi:predicted MFS family arabinose efflux permease